MAVIPEDALDILFRTARSQNRWLDEPVPEAMLYELHELMKWGPTSANGYPQRIVFASSEDAKEKLASVAMEGNKEKIRTAPVVAILANDSLFYEKLPELFPHDPGMPKFFRENPEIADITAFRNGTLQSAYFMIAARCLGLDCGPMSGFDNATCDEIFFPDGQWKSNFLCGIGHGDPEGVLGRLPRPTFDDVCRIV